jgi:transaldolase
MSNSYFLRVKAETRTRLWVNNPTSPEIDLALAQGAVGCTTNPAFGGGLLKRAPDEIKPVIEAAVRDSRDDARSADLVQQRLVARIAERFAPLHERSGGKEGFVSIQGSPEADHDAERILEEAREGHALAPNVAPKIPATLPGFAAFEHIVAAGYPSIVTEVFSLDQLVYACEAYLRVTSRSGVRPPFFISPITGILGDHLKRVAAGHAIECDPAVIDWAGVILARACNRVVEERGYPVTLLFGGARIMRDFTGLVGGATAATINYSTIDELVLANPTVEDSIHAAVDSALVSELRNKFADFALAMQLGALEPEAFESFGPVQHFRNNFLSGWIAVRQAIAAERLAAERVR